MTPKLPGYCIKSSLKSAIAALIVASASLAGAQTLQTLYSGANPHAALTLGNDERGSVRENVMLPPGKGRPGRSEQGDRLLSWERGSNDSLPCKFLVI